MTATQTLRFSNPGGSLQINAGDTGNDSIAVNGFGSTGFTASLAIDGGTGSYTAILKRNGKTVFKTRVGIGKSYWPTPSGEFYIRDKLTHYGNPFYGPVMFGTSARSPTLTDWPGGGYVGVHGTNQPGLIPGQISHGCIRMKNAAILTLARLMKVGSPLTIR